MHTPFIYYKYGVLSTLFLVLNQMFLMISGKPLQGVDAG